MKIFGGKILRARIDSCVAVCFLGVFAVVISVLANPGELQTQRTDTTKDVANRADATTPALAAPDPLTYEGPGVVSITTHGVLVLSPGERLRPNPFGFDLHWDREMIKAAGRGEVERVNIVGDVWVHYDLETQSLNVWARDCESGEVFEGSYPHVVQADPSQEGVFLTALDSFFEYMHSEEPAGDPRILLDDPPDCTGCAGGCCYACRGASGECYVCCPANTIAKCTSSGGGQECSCTCGVVGF